jgi:putative spermidine/putrescine transport system permease protein
MSELLARTGLATFVAAFFIYLMAPILIVVVVSFSSLGYIGFPIPSYTLKWFHRVWEYVPFLHGLWVSVELALASTVFATILGVPAALGLARARSGWANALATFLLAPLSMPMVVLGFALLFYLSALGFGLSFTPLLIAHTVIAIPYIVRTVIGVYRSLPPDFEEAAAILGADKWRSFLHVTLPLIRPGVFAGGLFAFLVSFDNLPISYFFGTPSTATLPVVMLSYIQDQFDPSIAAVSTVQMVLALLVLLFVDRIYGLRRLGVPS